MSPVRVLFCYCCCFLFIYLNTLALYLSHTCSLIRNKLQVQATFSKLQIPFLLFTLKVLEIELNTWTSIYRILLKRKQSPCVHASFLRNTGIDSNRSIFISIHTINADASSSVHHYIDGAEEHLSPSERALGSVIEPYTCVFIR